MSLPIIKRARVHQDLVECFAYIARDKFEPAERFLKVADEAFERISRTPHMGRIWVSKNVRASGVRVYPMPEGFRNYLIFYLVSSDAIEILAVIQGAQNLDQIVRTIDF